MKPSNSIPVLILIAITISTVFIGAQASLDLISNGGFENGNLSGWTVIGDARAVRLSHSGTFSAQLGSRRGTGQISEQFTLSSGGSAKLSFWYRGFPGDYDKAALVISLMASNGAIIAQWDGKINGKWHQVTYDIGSSYSGQTLTLRFFGTPDFVHESSDRVCVAPGFCVRPHKVIIYPVFVYIDDVSIATS